MTKLKISEMAKLMPTKTARRWPENDRRQIDQRLGADMDDETALMDQLARA